MIISLHFTLSKNGVKFTGKDFNLTLRLIIKKIIIVKNTENYSLLMIQF